MLFFAKNRVFFAIFTKILTNFYKIYEIYKILCKKNLIFFEILQKNGLFTQHYLQRFRKNGTFFAKKFLEIFTKFWKNLQKKHLSEKNKKFLKNCNFLKIFIFSYTFYTPDINVFFFIKYNKNIYKKCINFTIFFAFINFCKNCYFFCHKIFTKFSLFSQKCLPGKHTTLGVSPENQKNL